MPLGLSTWMGGHQGGQQLPQPSAPPPSVLNSLSGPGLSLSSPSNNGGPSNQESYSIQTQDLTLITKLLGLQTATATAVRTAEAAATSQQLPTVMALRCVCCSRR